MSGAGTVWENLERLGLVLGIVVAAGTIWGWFVSGFRAKGVYITTPAHAQVAPTADVPRLLLFKPTQFVLGLIALPITAVLVILSADRIMDFPNYDFLKLIGSAIVVGLGTAYVAIYLFALLMSLLKDGAISYLTPFWLGSLTGGFLFAYSYKL